MKSSCFAVFLTLISAPLFAQQLGSGEISPIDELINAQDAAPEVTPPHREIAAPPSIPATHKVKSGDNPWTIAKEYGISMDEFLKLNGITDTKGLQIGEVLKLPQTPVSEKMVAPESTEPVEEFDPGDYEVYTIKNGDNPWTVAKRLKVDYEAMIALNDISNPRDLKIGQKLKIPKKGEVIDIPKAAGEDSEELFDADGHEVYVIKNGDNPWTVARRLKVDYEALLDLNQIGNPRDLKVGQKLKLPKKGEVIPDFVAPEATPEPEFDADGHDVYVIKKGDNPWDVARALKVDYEKLISLNNISNPRDLKIGQKLKIPAK
ncbi:MAG: LysM peptidoglycan-binding domain-containing protein [Verrucomicrobiales bacterium]|nr:LysM peptidoglycan-binding domain-containing protein [Verrucomicrobiales bacterium]